MKPAHPLSVPEKIQRQAIKWLILLQSEQLSPELRQSFEHWLSLDFRHRAAYYKAHEFWQELDSLPHETIAEIRQLSAPNSSSRSR